MNSFKVTQIIDATKIRVSPRWKIETKNSTAIEGDVVQIRGIDPHGKDEVVINRLKKLLLNKSDLQFNAPEVVYIDSKPIVSCSIYLARTNIASYFPEFVYKDED